VRLGAKNLVEKQLHLVADPRQLAVQRLQSVRGIPCFLVQRHSGKNDGASVANEEDLKILRQGVAAWNDWRKKNPELRPDLGGARFTDENLSGADLHGANLYTAELLGANLWKANLDSVELAYAFLREADLFGANLQRADLMSADLILANRARVDLAYAKLTTAHLEEAKLRGAQLIETDLRNATLTGSYVYT